LFHNFNDTSLPLKRKIKKLSGLASFWLTATFQNGKIKP